VKKWWYRFILFLDGISTTNSFKNIAVILKTKFGSFMPIPLFNRSLLWSKDILFGGLKTTCRQLFIVLLFFGWNSVSGQLDSIRPTNEQAFLLQSTVLNQQRSIWVHLPPDYYSATNRRYPVLYVLDGDGHFKYVSELVDFLSDYDRDRTDEIIVVGIVNIDRRKDLTPVHPRLANGSSNNDSISTVAGAGKFLDFITNELIPEIDKKFRTAPYRILAGHSLAGQFALYAKITHPALFQSTILISPAVFSDNYMLITKLGILLKNHTSTQGKLFLTVGKENTAIVDSITMQLKRYAPEKFDWSYRHYADENHFSVPYKSFFDALKFFYKNWFLDFYGNEKMSLSGIKAHFGLLSEEFGYPVTPSEDFINSCGYKELNAGDINGAIDFFKENVRNFPNSYNAYDSMGEAYFKNGQKQLAIDNYEKSIELNPGNESGRAMLKKIKQL
jgi:predicted alpha/beta superfamily hydrolase